MSLQILPNWCKKLGLILFIVTAVAGGLDAFLDGLNGVPQGTHHFFKDLYGEGLFHIIYITPTIGLFLYLLSKEKAEDDFIKLLRLESYQITVITFLVAAILFYIFRPDIVFGLDWFLSLFMLLFLVVFYVKKQAYS